jgi:hypothetical protein
MTGVGLPSSLALARVGSDILKATEDLEGGVTLDALVFAEVGLLSAVNLGELDVLLLEGCSGLLILGGEGLAVTAPGSKDCGMKLLATDGGEERLQWGLTLSKDEIVGLDELLEGVLGQLVNI